MQFVKGYFGYEEHKKETHVSPPREELTTYHPSAMLEQCGPKTTAGTVQAEVKILLRG
jgi:hypothetical protein